MELADPIGCECDGILRGEEPRLNRDAFVRVQPGMVGANAVPAERRCELAGDAFNTFAAAAENEGGEQAVHT